MNLIPFFKSIIDEDKSAVVICDTEHNIIYMNDAACQNYSKSGGKALLYKNLLDCHNEKSREMIKRVVDWFKADGSHNRVHTFYNEKQNKDVYMIALRDDSNALIGYYEKHEYRTCDNTPFYKLEE